jgi:TonB-linked SusC/RagA family outer membrane protein
MSDDRSRRSGLRLGPSWLATLLVAFLLAPPLAAQQEPGVIAGRVVAERTQQPLPAAQVQVQGTNLGAQTGSNGEFRISGVSGTSARIVVRRIGYGPVEQTVQVGSTNLVITMSPRAINLDEVIVTGTTGATEARAIGNAVSQINAADVVATAPVSNFQELLNARATGVAVVAGSGQVGTGSRVRIRGASSLSLTADPLIYVDGVRVDNAQATGPLNQAFGSRSISRWNDFNPEDIESIEVIKGPAAATLYGTEAANGVIQIITKRGAAGAPQWSLTARTGIQRFYDYENRLYTNYWQDPVTNEIQTLNIAKLERERGNPDIWRTGHTNEVNLSVGGGSQQFRYYAGVGGEQATGADRANKLDRYNGRLNLSLTPGGTWDLSANLGYTSGRTYLPLEAGGGGATWTTYWANPSTLNDPRRGFYSGTPEQYLQGFEIWQDADRFTGSVTFNHRPANWFHHRVIVGTDQLGEDNQEIAQRNDDLTIFGLDGPDGGYMEVSTRNVSYSTFDYVANATWTPINDWEFTSSVGAQYYARNTQTRAVSGSGFPAPGLKSLGALSLISLDDDDLIENNTVGVFFQQQFAWRNRLFLTGAVRADDNSAFGENFDLVYYPKASVSWVVSEEPFFNIPWLSQLKLRGAYGQSGLQPAALTAIPTYVPGGGGTVTPGNIGNPDLGPERSDELELGFDAGMFDDRMSLQVTYFRGTVRDGILERSVPPSSGYGGTQFFNAGRIDRSGIEFMVTASPFQSENFGWDMTFSLSNNSNKIKDLGNTDFVTLGSTEAHAVGHSVGAWFSQKVVSAEFDPVTRTAINVMCDDGAGGSVACANAPRVFLGHTTPQTEGAFSSTFTFLRDFRLNALFDFKGGYKKLDGNARVRCHLFGVCRANYFPEEYDPVYIAQIQSGTGFIDDLVQDASFTKLRELSLTYTLPTELSNRLGMARSSITVAGRNLLTWTDYGGLEPEASFIGGARGLRGQWEQNVLPQLQQWIVTLNVGF